ncbi:hypothetical protein [Jatrophihabitans sp.]|uniref:hypothetical protein n=1 Tax=Jatrophihabitans sp. TaxID=1932789 RepID=UPI0030C663BB|nr:hypothetical protein [Jatrophihabitans sp.]
MTENKPRDLTAADRRELKSLIKKQFELLRNDIARREVEMKAEVEHELLQRYRHQDARIAETHRELERAEQEYELERARILDALRAAEPSLNAYYGPNRQVHIEDRHRTQLHSAAVAAIPDRVAAAKSALDQQELDLIRELTIGALDSAEAHAFIGRIPTVGTLVPNTRMAEIENMLPELPSEVPGADPWGSIPPF